jgi:3,4-dihydroxy 2-butanone 4-phosphate synthase / GTP cyclohydrolase II
MVQVLEPLAPGRHAPTPLEIGCGDRQAALIALVAGLPVVVWQKGRPDGYLAFLADRTSVEVMSFAVRHTSGFLCVALPASRCDALGLPPMWPTHVGGSGVEYAVTVDAISGVSTGISAADRTRTVQTIADPAATADDFSRPGHVVVAVASGSGSFADVLLDLARDAGAYPAVAFGAVVSEKEPVRMANNAELKEFADRHQLQLVSVGDDATS